MADFTRRDLLTGGAAVLATATLPAVPLIAEGQGETSAFRTRKGSFSRETITTNDGTKISKKEKGNLKIRTKKKFTTETLTPRRRLLIRSGGIATAASLSAVTIAAT